MLYVKPYEYKVKGQIVYKKTQMLALPQTSAAELRKLAKPKQISQIK
jgi:exosome complex RNA-binding protein Csl4